MKYVFVVNPRAGAGAAEAIVRSVINTLPQKADCEVYVTKAILDATDYVEKKSAEATAENPIRFIACGGDGTICEVFTGAVGKKNVSVSCFPCGSGNDFVKVFGGEGAFTVEDLLNAEEKDMDVLKVGDRYSFNVTNFGFDTTVAITVNEVRDKKGTSNKSSYTKGIVKALVTSMNNKCKVWADGELLNPEGTLLLCTVANGQYVGGSFKCAPRARIDDGLLEVCLFKPISRLTFVKVLDPYTNGQHLDDEKCKKLLTYRQAKKVDVEAPEGFAYSLDGEIIYENKFSIEIVPAALKLAMPNNK